MKIRRKKYFLTNLVLLGRLMRLPVAVAGRPSVAVEGRLPEALLGGGGPGTVNVTPPLAMWY